MYSVETKLLSTSDLIVFFHPPALIPPSFWHFASLNGSEPAESRLGLTLSLCLTHRGLWKTETHWLHLTLGIQLPCSAWYNRAFHFCLSTSALTFMAAVTRIILMQETISEVAVWKHSQEKSKNPTAYNTKTLKWTQPIFGQTEVCDEKDYWDASYLVE